MIWWMTNAAAGTWILEEELITEVRPPVPVGWVDTRSRARWLVDWTEGEPTWTARLCAMEFDPVMGAKMTWSDALLAAIPVVTRSVRFDGTHFVSAATETIGDADDDHDGHPGITVQVAHPRAGAGEVYVRHTSDLAWDGVLGADGAITGTIRYRPIQDQLGASTWWLRLAIKQREADDLTSTFSLVPAPAGTTCAGG
ncbi:MAG: hypothetical protein ABMB14_12250 [Myxococcota bacterium]